MSSSLYAAKTVTVNEKLEKHFSKSNVKQIRLALAEEIFCHYMDLCDYSNNITSGLKEEVIIKTKTYSETIKKRLTLISLEVDLSETIQTICSIKMNFKPRGLSVSSDGDFEEVKSHWEVRSFDCDY